MKKIIFLLVLCAFFATTLWTSCVKDANAIDAQKSGENPVAVQDQVSDRSCNKTVTFTNGLGLSLCGYLPGTGCIYCGTTSASYSIDTNSVTLTLLGYVFTLSNRSGALKVVTMSVGNTGSCVSKPLTISIPAHSSVQLAIVGTGDCCYVTNLAPCE